VLDGEVAKVDAVGAVGADHVQALELPVDHDVLGSRPRALQLQAAESPLAGDV
jgi:hypothetical protein